MFSAWHGFRLGCSLFLTNHNTLVTSVNSPHSSFSHELLLHRPFRRTLKRPHRRSLAHREPQPEHAAQRSTARTTSTGDAALRGERERREKAQRPDHQRLDRPLDDGVGS